MKKKAIIKLYKKANWERFKGTILVFAGAGTFLLIWKYSNTITSIFGVVGLIVAVIVGIGCLIIGAPMYDLAFIE